MPRPGHTCREARPVSTQRASEKAIDEARHRLSAHEHWCRASVRSQPEKTFTGLANIELVLPAGAFDPRVMSSPESQLRSDGAGDGVERVLRVSPSGSFEFLINYNDERRELEVAPGGFEMLTRADLGHQVALEP
jgi:hypothetical protein